MGRVRGPRGHSKSYSSLQLPTTLRPQHASPLRGRLCLCDCTTKNKRLVCSLCVCGSLKGRMSPAKFISSSWDPGPSLLRRSKLIGGQAGSLQPPVHAANSLGGTEGGTPEPPAHARAPLPWDRLRTLRDRAVQTGLGDCPTPTAPGSLAVHTSMGSNPGAVGLPVGRFSWTCPLLGQVGLTCPLPVPGSQDWHRCSRGHGPPEHHRCPSWPRPGSHRTLGKFKAGGRQCLAGQDTPAASAPGNSPPGPARFLFSRVLSPPQAPGPARFSAPSSRQNDLCLVHREVPCPGGWHQRRHWWGLAWKNRSQGNTPQGLHT